MLIMWLLSCARPMTVEQAFAAVWRNDANALRRWLDAGGDPDAVLDDKSMLYVATGPKGGPDVLDLLLARGADPELGSMAYTYSPMMNAASWCWREGVEKLLAAGADPRAAIGLVCEGSDGEEIRKILENAAGL